MQQIDLYFIFIQISFLASGGDVLYGSVSKKFKKKLIIYHKDQPDVTQYLLLHVAP